MSPTTLYIIAGVVLLIIVGYVQVGLKLHNIAERLRLTREYFEQLTAYLSRIQRRGYDAEANQIHSWLVHRGGKMQMELGADGTMIYQEPITHRVWPDYEILTNMLPQLRDEALSGLLSGPGNPVYDRAARTCHDVLIRHDGRLHDLEEQLSKDLRNPIKQLRRGVEFIVTLPLLFIAWTGLLEYSRVLQATESPAGRLITGLLTLIAGLAALMQIVVGWEQFWQNLPW